MTGTLHTPAGPITGLTDGPVHRYLGIPYAEPPTGTRRFALPERRAPFRRPYDATCPGATSQIVPLSARTTIPEPSIPGDDILNLNVTAPAGAAGCPVLVWVHGGGFVAGSPASPWYDGRSFARDGIVTVTVGHRLGVDGFAPLDGVPANLGLRDVLLALDWVRDNITAFGGDPARVTLAGQSAGGAAVLALLSAPAAEGRFHRAVSMSGGFFEPTPGFPEKLAAHLGVPPTRAGFAGLSVAQLQACVRDLKGDDAVALAPVTGDDLLPVPIPDGLTRHGLDVPLLMGATTDEFTDPRLTAALFRSACPRAARARRHAPAGTWLYSFNWPAPGAARHCMDVPFFHDVLDAPGVPEALGPRPPAALATLMNADLTAFVHGQGPFWQRAFGVPGDPAREYGAAGAADTTGAYDAVLPAAQTEARAC